MLEWFTYGRLKAVSEFILALFSSSLPEDAGDRSQIHKGSPVPVVIPGLRSVFLNVRLRNILFSTTMGQVRGSMDKERALSIGSVQIEESSSLTSEHEQRALRKFDIFLLPAILLLILMAWLDRTNIGNAKIFGLESKLLKILSPAS